MIGIGISPMFKRGGGSVEPPTFITSASAYGNINTVSTSNINTTTSNLIVVTCQSYSPAGVPVITDSSGNTWTLISSITSSTTTMMSAYYCINPTTSATHNFTVTKAGAYASISVLCFGGTPVTYNNFASNTGGSVTSFLSGSITPSSRNITISSINYWLGSLGSVDNGFTVAQLIPPTITTLSGGTAYKINSGTVNPLWSWTTLSGEVSSLNFSFSY